MQNMKYTTIAHKNSNNSIRRKLCGWVQSKGGGVEYKDHYTPQSSRNRMSGKALPHARTPEILRTCRSKYEPHIGKRQKLRIKARS
jgi:hypothetical protein